MDQAAAAGSRAGVIIPAAGHGSRMGRATPKQFLDLGGTPVLARTVAACVACPGVWAVAVAVTPGREEEVRSLLAPLMGEGQRLLVTAGGASRQDSVRAGLAALPREVEVVLVHDAARPLVGQDLLLACVEAVRRHGAAMAALPVQDTLKRVAEDGLVQATVDRRDIWQAQTPQGARRDLLEQAFALARARGFQGTDEASLLEHARVPVRVVMGSAENFKITRPGDLELARALWSHRQTNGNTSHARARG